jgi:hypothetical protein
MPLLLYGLLGHKEDDRIEDSISVRTEQSRILFSRCQISLCCTASQAIEKRSAKVRGRELGLPIR